MAIVSQALFQAELVAPGGSHLKQCLQYVTVVNLILLSSRRYLCALWFESSSSHQRHLVLVSECECHNDEFNNSDLAFFFSFF